MVRTGDDELRKRRRGELVERDLGLPRATLDHERARALARARAVAGRAGPATSPPSAGSRGGRPPDRPFGPSAHQRRPSSANRATAGSSSATRVAGGSITVSEPSASAAAAAASSGDHAAVRVTDEVVARAEQPRHQPRVLLEVDAVDVRAGREPRPLDEHELEPLCERALPTPGRRGARDAPCTKTRRSTRRILGRATSLREFSLIQGISPVTSWVVCSGRDDAPLLWPPPPGSCSARSRWRWASARSSAPRSAPGNRAPDRCAGRHPAGGRRRLLGLHAAGGRRDVSAGIFSTPRPMPPRLVPALAGSVVVLVALPVYALAGWPLAGLGPRRSPVVRRARARRATDAPARG